LTVILISWGTRIDKGGGGMAKGYRIYFDEDGRAFADGVPLDTHDIQSKRKKEAYRKKMEAEEVTQWNRKELWIAAYNRKVEEISKKLKLHELGAYLVLVVHLKMDSKGKVMLDTKKPMTLEDIAKKIGKKDRQTREIINALVREKALTKVKEGRHFVYYVNSDIHTMGEPIKEGESFTKIMQKATKNKLRLLHRGKFAGLTLEQIGLLYKIIPYFHWSKFYLVENPDEQDPDKLQPFDLKKLAEKIGISYAAMKRHMSGLMKAGIVMKSSAYGRNIYTVNPQILYRIDQETAETASYKQRVIEEFNMAKKGELGE